MGQVSANGLQGKVITVIDGNTLEVETTEKEMIKCIADRN